MNNSELEIIEKWQSDPSFINWVKESNKEDVIKWEIYFDENPKQLEFAEIAKFSILHIKPKPLSEDKNKSNAALTRLYENIKAPEKQRESAKIISFPKYLRVAASLAIFIVVGIWGVSNLNNKGDEIVWETQDEQKEILLADGTKVILNTYSKLTYFENDVRLVDLTGEAYFDVTKQASNNSHFEVKTKDLKVTVLGTEFNVNSESGKTSVYLDEGKVKLSLGQKVGNEIEMAPGELISYSEKQDKILENRKANTLEQTAWKEGVILFKEASLDHVLESVSLIYGVTFESNFLNNKDQLFTGGIPVNDLDIALQTLKGIYQLDIEKIEGKYIVQ